MASFYISIIEKHLPSLKTKLPEGFHPYHVEALMRTEYSTLDHLPLPKFKRAMENAVLECISLGVADSDLVAASYGLLPKNKT